MHTPSVFFLSAGDRGGRKKRYWWQMYMYQYRELWTCSLILIQETKVWEQKKEPEEIIQQILEENHDTIDDFLEMYPKSYLLLKYGKIRNEPEDIVVPYGSFGYFGHDECVHSYRIR